MLSPVLFNIVIDDLAVEMTRRAITLSDDTKLGAFESSGDREIINRGLERL